MSSGSLLELADAALENLQARKKAERGIIPADVLRIFPGARIVKAAESGQQTLSCVHCGGKMIERLRKHKYVLACPRCGRARR